MNQFPTPSEMMRAKRPYLYSDSERRDAYRLSEAELSHHLDTLTDRNQHKDFEVFCRKLSELELCPNLRPQTGPEGGGDGKVDTETFPVDDGISERWYIGDGKSGSERWGFAFSAKKDWSDKVRSDVKAIVETGRGYDRIIFFTSRAARQRDRLRIEDNLQKEHGVKVTIMDREWIIDRVFSHGHKDLVFEHLKAGHYEPDKIKLGPNDFKRQQALDELETRLKKLGSTAQEKIQAVSDTFEAARLSRELEKPQFETVGRFQRAVTFAKKYGASYQHLSAAYERAWTALWWFDDVETMHEQYDVVEAIAFASGHADHIGKVCNLYQVLVACVMQGFETPNDLSLVDRSARLRQKLSELVADRSKPNNALHAETLLIFHRLNETALSGERQNLDEIWQGLCGIIDRAAGLGEFPAEMLEAVVEALGEYMPDSQSFDELVEKLAEFMAERSKEIKAGTLYLQQGERKLAAERRIDGIKWLGRAVIHLSKEECRQDQAKALYFLAVGYRGAGLYWAARATALASIIQYLALTEIEGGLRVETIPALNLFATLSLQLGHILDVLSAIRFLHAIGDTAPLDDESVERLKSQIIDFDRSLACLLIIQSSEDIRRLERLPDVLEGLGLFSARSALLYRLGHINELQRDDSLPEGTVDQEIHETMAFIASQPICKSLPKKVVLFDDAFHSVRTKILGVEIEIQASNSSEGVLQAETYAAAFEGFAATLLNAEVYPHTEKFVVRIRQLDELQEASITTDDEAVMEIRIPSHWRLADLASIGTHNQNLIFSCIHALSSISVARDAAATIEDLVATENVFERATLFCRAGISRNRIFGTSVGRISDWDDFITRKFSMAANAPAMPATVKLPPLQNDDADAPPMLGEIRSHNDVVIRAIVNPRLWDAAQWKGMMYGVTQRGQPPILGLMFADATKGEAIFEEWIARFGREDARDEIYISAIKGIDKHNPFHYRGHITQDFDRLPEEPGKVFINTSRMTTMMADNHRNLEMFRDHLRSCGAFFLVPAVFDEAGVPELRMKLAILKRKFSVKEAWQIGSADIDAMAIRADDNVIIPEGEIAPPVDQLAKMREDLKRRRNNGK